MNRRQSAVVILGASGLLFVLALAAYGQNAPAGAPSQAAATAPAAAPMTAPATRPAPKPLSDNVKKGLEWLVKHQLENGSWAQGEESTEMGGGLAKIKDTPNVADTCMAAMAVFRSGSTPAGGPHKDNVLKAVKFVCEQVEQAKNDDLSVTALQGTRTQSKLGTYIDTFMAGQMLGEMRPGIADKELAGRVDAAMAKIARKMEKNQQKDGGWANQGWAPTLAQAQASKAFNGMARGGAIVDEQVRQKAEGFARNDYAGGTSGPGKNNAGVELYSAGAQIAAMRASDSVNGGQISGLNAVIASPTASQPAIAQAKEDLKRINTNAITLKKAEDDIIARMDDAKFISGFGSNGGEEFLSYLNIGESLIAGGADGFARWDKSITPNINRVQNQDGSWTGHHCITGRTFCTSAALMVLMIDRSPAPVVAKIKDAKK